MTMNRTKGGGVACLLAAGALIGMLSGGAGYGVAARHPIVAKTAPLSYRGTLRMFAYTYGPTPVKVKGAPTPQLVLLAKQWERLHPGITIQFVQGPTGTESLNTWELTEASAGKLPAIDFGLYNGINTFFPAGTFVNLNPFWGQPDPYVAGKTWGQVIRPSVIADVRAASGASYVVNGDWVIFATFYNKADFAKAGIVGVPHTWSQFLADSQKLKSHGMVPFASGFASAPVGVDVMTWPLAEFYNNLYGANYKRLLFTGGNTVNPEDDVIAIKKGIYGNKNPGWLSFWQMMKQWSKYWEPGYMGSHPTAGFETFVKGKAAMYMGGSWDLNGMHQAKIPFGWGSFPDPTPDKAAWKYATSFNDGPLLGGPTGAFSYAVASRRSDQSMTAAKEQAAINWLEFISTPAHDTAIVNQLGSDAPTVAGAKPLPFFRRIEKPGYFKAPPLLFFGGYWDTTQARSGLFRLFQEYMLNEVSLKTFGVRAEQILQAEATQLTAEHHWNLSKYLH